MVCIRNDITERKDSQQAISKEIGGLFEQVQDELSEHREAINANSAEMQENYSCMSELSTKLDKLSERLERMEVFLQMRANFAIENKTFTVQPLTKSEQHVFLIIYALEEEKGLITSADIARKSGFPHFMIAEYIARLVEKGIPLIRKYVNGSPYMRINPEFKRLQAMENILHIDTAQKELVNF